uniref:Uncharacterized protein n=1 Tax=Rhizophora mucronata TaxID=61149 RepID=A0A2P2PIL1_RHIMU
MSANDQNLQIISHHSGPYSMD